MPVSIRLLYQSVAECLDESDASDNVLTFDEPVRAVEIWHDEEEPQEFEVNGITLHVAPGGWRSIIDGISSDEVTIPSGVDCIVSRLV